MLFCDHWISTAGAGQKKISKSMIVYSWKKKNNQEYDMRKRSTFWITRSRGSARPLFGPLTFSSTARYKWPSELLVPFVLFPSQYSHFSTFMLYFNVCLPRLLLSTFHFFFNLIYSSTYLCIFPSISILWTLKFNNFMTSDWLFHIRYLDKQNDWHFHSKYKTRLK